MPRRRSTFRRRGRVGSRGRRAVMRPARRGRRTRRRSTGRSNGRKTIIGDRF